MDAQEEYHQTLQDPTITGRTSVNKLFKNVKFCCFNI